MKRLCVFDAAKFLGICMVVLYHTLLLSSVLSQSPMQNYLFLTCNTIFFIVSGIFAPTTSKITSIKNWLKYIAKITLQLFIPCLTFAVLSLFLRKDYTIAIYLKTFLTFPGVNLWFLWILFIINILYSFCAYIESKFHIKSIFISKCFSPVMFGVILISLLGIYLLFKIDLHYFGFNLLILNSIFYLFGAIFSNLLKTPFVKLLCRKTLIQIIIGTICLCFTLFCSFYFKSINALPDTNILYIFIRVAGSISSVYSLLVLLKIFDHLLSLQLISIPGHFSLEIYYIHSLILLITGTGFLRPINNEIIISTVFFLILIISSYLILFVICCVPFFHLILFGKSKSIYNFEKRLFQTTIFC